MGHQIVRAIEPRLGGIAREAGARIEHGRQRLEIERDQAGRVLGHAAAFGHHHRDRLAHIGELPLGQHRRVHGKADGGERQCQRDAVAGEQRAQLRVGQHRPHARQCARPAGIDAAQQRMRERAAHEARMQQARQLEIIHEPPRAAQQSPILQPQHRRAARVRGDVTAHWARRWVGTALHSLPLKGAEQSHMDLVAWYSGADFLPLQGGGRRRRRQEGVPPPRKFRVCGGTPTRIAARSDLPLSGGGVTEIAGPLRPNLAPIGRDLRRSAH